MAEVMYCSYGDSDAVVECHADADLLVMLIVMLMPMWILMVVLIVVMKMK